MTLIYKLDASALASIWADDGKTVQASDGSVVAAWTSSGSLTTDAVQATNGNRPLYRSNYASSGYAGVEFDGVSSDELTVAHDASLNASVYDIWFVITPLRLTGAFQGVFVKSTTSAWNDGISCSINASTIYAGDANFMVLSRELALTKTLVQIKLKNGDRRLYANLVPNVVATAAAVPTSTSTMRIGNGLGGFPFQGVLHELRIYTGEETLDTQISVTAELARKWGLSTLSTVPSTGGARMVNVRGGADQ